jgi:hypothetical protein
MKGEEDASKQLGVESFKWSLTQRLPQQQGHRQRRPRRGKEGRNASKQLREQGEEKQKEASQNGKGGMQDQ